MSATWIYRITHHQNLESILRQGRLLTQRSSVLQQNFRPIGDQTLIRARSEIPVPVPPYGTFADYVPFYFGLRSPMLYQIHRGFDGVQQIEQREIIYFVSSLEELKSQNVVFVFTDGHAKHQLTRFFPHTDDLTQLDWHAIHANFWANDENDPDRKRKKQAECLAFGDVPLACIRYILVYDEAMKSDVETRLLAHDEANQIQVRVSREKAYF